MSCVSRQSFSWWGSLVDLESPPLWVEMRDDWRVAGWRLTGERKWSAVQGVRGRAGQNSSGTRVVVKP